MSRVHVPTYGLTVYVPTLRLYSAGGLITLVQPSHLKAIKHRLQVGLVRYLIGVAVLPFVPYSQPIVSKVPSQIDMPLRMIGSQTFSKSQPYLTTALDHWSSYVPFMPIEPPDRLHYLYYRDCWHRDMTVLLSLALIMS